jgi:hypothetical protein
MEINGWSIIRFVDLTLTCNGIPGTRPQPGVGTYSIPYIITPQDRSLKINAAIPNYLNAQSRVRPLLAPDVYLGSSIGYVSLASHVAYAQGH